MGVALQKFADGGKKKEKVFKLSLVVGRRLMEDRRKTKDPSKKCQSRLYKSYRVGVGMHLKQAADANDDQAYVGDLY